jgi:hypothetical protein
MSESQTKTVTQPAPDAVTAALEAADKLAEIAAETIHVTGNSVNNRVVEKRIFALTGAVTAYRAAREAGK